MPNTANVAMPAHMRIGRGSGAGPVIGGYLTWNFGPLNVAASATDTVVCAFIAPCDLRVEKITWGYRTDNAATANTLALYKNATPVVAGATSLSSASTTFDLDSLNDSWALPSGETASANGVTLSTVAGARDVAAGQWILASITTDASVGGLQDFSIQFLCVMLSHTKPNSEND